MRTLNILSLGAGVQSSVVLLLSCRGILPKLDYAIFADTQWEPSPVYAHLWWLVEQATAAGIPVLVGSKGNIKTDMLRSMVRGAKKNGERWASMPLYTIVAGAEREGRIRRQCTKEYKLDVIERTTRREILGLDAGQRIPADVHVNQWIGISIDEKRRMRMSGKRWITNHYPLIGWPEPMLERPWTRAKCLEWFATHYPDRHLPRSACIGCPFHSDQEWNAMREQRPQDFADACEFDRRMRHCDGMRGEVFLHRSCQPLGEVDFSRHTPTQQNLFATEECLGMCGV